jgi:hypothetical protein
MATILVKKGDPALTAKAAQAQPLRVNSQLYEGITNKAHGEAIIKCQVSSTVRENNQFSIEYLQGQDGLVVTVQSTKIGAERCGFDPSSMRQLLVRIGKEAGYLSKT